jgi:hypothetical protein
MFTALSEAEGLRYTSSRFASLAFGAFYCAVPFMIFYEFINFRGGILGRTNIRAYVTKKACHQRVTGS